MAHYQISVDSELLHQLFDGDEGVAKLVESVLNQVLQAQATEHLKAQPYERTLQWTPSSRHKIEDS